MIISVRDSPAEKLQMFLNEFVTPTWKSLPKGFKLDMYGVEITPPIWNLLVQLLYYQVLPQAPDAAINIDSSEKKWDSVALKMCGFAQRDATRLATDDDSCCTIDHRNLLALTLARRTSELQLKECPEILHDLLNVPQLEMNWWVLRQDNLSAVECAGVGSLVQRSARLKSLVIGSKCLEDSYVLGEGLCNAIHLEVLNLLDNSSAPPTNEQQELSTTEVVQERHVIAAPLLQNPQSHLRVLDLNSCQLEDCHVIAIAQILRTSQLQTLYLIFNNIQAHGILELAHQLPNFKRLKRLYLGRNPWETTKDDREKCFAALLQGMMENYSIECLHPFQERPQATRRHYHDMNRAMEFPIKQRPQAPLLKYYAVMNRAGRRILSTSDPVPVGLWELILERAGKGHWPSTHFDDIQDRKSLLWRANAVYFFLRNCHHIILP